jgi:hypothetical protein
MVSSGASIPEVRILQLSSTAPPWFFLQPPTHSLVYIRQKSVLQCNDPPNQTLPKLQLPRSAV